MVLIPLISVRGSVDIFSFYSSYIKNLSFGNKKSELGKYLRDIARDNKDRKEITYGILLFCCVSKVEYLLPQNYL